MSFLSSNSTHNLLSSFTLFLLLVTPSLCLNLDGTLLLSFKYSILSDPFSVLENWDYTDETPCLWKGVLCAEVESPFNTPDVFRVVSLNLPNSQIMGSIPEELGLIPHLRNLDLSNNFLNGTIPDSLLNASELTSLSLSNNDISGGLFVEITGKKLQNLKVLNLSNNEITGNLPSSLALLPNLNVISLRGNQFYGLIPSGFHYVQVLDLSSNLFNGSLPTAFGGEALKYLNLSSNDLSGFVPLDFATKIPSNVIMDISFNKLTGEIPDSMSLNNQKTESFKGNVDLCGKPLKKPCTVPSTLSIPPNISGTNTSSPAIAAIPQTMDSNSPGSSSTQNQARSRLKLGKITGIVVGDLIGVAVLAIISFYVYQMKKKKIDGEKISKENAATTVAPPPPPPPPLANQIQPPKSIVKESEFSIAKGSNSPPKSTTVWSCLNAITNGEETSDVTASDSDDSKKDDIENQIQNKNQRPLIMVDGGTELELETLLKASAYILGSSNGSTIVYKAVLENGDSFAVRRIGESGVERFKEFENQIKSIAKLRHPNLLRIRGFYWREDEKLVIYDYISGGSLANAGHGKVGLSPHHLSFGTRINIARGVAKGLTYIHEKKHVHGNVKPSNILLTQEMEPIISDLGLHKLLYGKHSHNKSDGSSRHFGSRRSSALLDNSINGTNPYFSPAGFMGCTSPYHAPESLNNVKPNPKWDVYSFGVILLELLTGKVFSDRELSQWTAGLVQEDRGRVLRMADMAIRGDMETKEDAIFECFKLGFRCASLVSQKRPSMKDALGVLQKIQSS